MSTPKDDDETVDQKTCQSFNMDNFCTDQTVPDIKTNDDDSQQSMEDSDATTEEMADSDATTEEMADLSDLVGSMSLENATKPINATLPHVDPTEHSVQENAHDGGKVVEDNNRMEHSHTLAKTVNQTFEPNSSQIVNSSQSLNILIKRTTTFQPPSTSTPNRHSPDTSLHQTTTPYIDHSNKLCISTTQLPSPAPSSNFMLQLTATTNSHYNEQLDSYDTEESNGDDSGFILAAETPQHLWRSPQVKVIDSTFS